MRHAFRRLPHPAPATVIAVIALVFAAGGLAAGAIPGHDGTIHSCYAKHGGQLRIVKTAKCGRGEKALSWNEHGARSVTVRASIVDVHLSCSMVTAGNYDCNGRATGTARCLASERATGGGYGTSSGSSVSATASYPSPTAGTPTGWTVSASSFSFGPTPNPPDGRLPIYAVCET